MLIGDVLKGIQKDVSINNGNIMVFLISSSSANHPLDTSKAWVILPFSQSTYFIPFTQNRINWYHFEHFLGGHSNPGIFDLGTLNIY